MDGLVPGFTALSLWEAEIIPPQEPLENGLEQLVIVSLPELVGESGTSGEFLRHQKLG